MGSYEDRLQRLKSVDISDDCKTEEVGGSVPASSPPPVRSGVGGQKHELSDAAAGLIATALKDFLRS